MADPSTILTIGARLLTVEPNANLVGSDLLLKYLVGAAMVAVTASSASAVTITSGSSSTGDAVGGGSSTIDITSGSGASFTEFYTVADGANAVSFTVAAAEDLAVTGISLTSTGALADLLALDFTISLTGSTEYTFDVFDVPNSTADFGAFGFEDVPFDMFASDIVTIVFDTNGTTLSDNVTLGATIFTAPIPVPASLPLIAGALGSLVLVRRKTA